MKNMLMPALIIVVVLGIFLALYKNQDLRRAYREAVKTNLSQAPKAEKEILRVSDISHLPEAVQRYIKYSGALGKEKVYNIRVVTEGKFKIDPEKGWFPIETVQYSFFEEPVRLYYLNLSMSGVPVVGLHKYENANASMLIKLIGLVTVGNAHGQEMNQGETVTVFNDMCLMAPASLVDSRIKWETIDQNKVKAYFKNRGITISADLEFNDTGQLINFTSEDRFYSPSGKNYQKFKWSTPIIEYQEMNGMKLPSYAEAIWDFHDGEYCYAKIHISKVKYNIFKFK